MKTMLLMVLVLLASVTFAQKTTTISTDANNGHYIIIRSITQTIHDSATANKTANYGDTIHTITVSPKYSAEKIRLFIRDSVGNSKVDSFYVEYKTPDGSWVKIAALNLLTYSYASVLVPGDGLTGVYEISAGYGSAYRVRRFNTEYAAVHSKFWVSVELIAS